MSLKAADQIVAEARRTIMHMHERPSMYVGNSADACAASVIDGMFWATHWLWAFAESKQATLRDVHSRVRDLHSCGPLGFVESFRQSHHEADGATVFEHVMHCWAEIDKALEIAIAQTTLE